MRVTKSERTVALVERKTWLSEGGRKRSMALAEVIVAYTRLKFNRAGHNKLYYGYFCLFGVWKAHGVNTQTFVVA